MNPNISSKNGALNDQFWKQIDQKKGRKLSRQPCLPLIALNNDHQEKYLQG
jgi:hypothetical protein